MFSLRRKKTVQPDPSTQIRGSPSLPELTSQGIPWPESLIDVSSIQQDDYPPTQKPSQSAGEPDLNQKQQNEEGQGAMGGVGGAGGGSISALYMSNGPATFNAKGRSVPLSRYSQKRARLPPTFNLMVVGGQGTGKTSLLRLLLETADISPGATVDQRAAVDHFLRGKPKSTSAIRTACVEICESRYDRVLFSVIDTPGLDFTEGRELKLERQVSAIMKYVDAQNPKSFDKARETNIYTCKCIYLIDPDSIMSVLDRRAQAALPMKARSETTVSYRNNPPDLIPDTSSGDESDEEEEAPLTMSPAELRVIRRLSARVNVLPVIARADSLTDEKLAAVKEAVRISLAESKLDFGVFDQSSKESNRGRSSRRRGASINGHANETVQEESADEGEEEEEEEEDEDDEERKSRPVIKLRPSRLGRNLSRSRSRRDLSRAATDAHRPVSPSADSIANVRFSAHIVARPDISSLMPFALITPETKGRAGRGASDSDELKTVPSSPAPQSEDGHTQTPSIVDSLPTPASRLPSRPFLQGPPDDLKGVFVRKFRWGTVDVLNPDHCDFAALRTTVLSTHLRVLKTHTKEVLYEKYRTEKLLARRATHNISEDDRKRLLEDLGL
ncbi:hypothetical protein K435DRAFT_793786 [Dendrothele bispora CBS 962.96]|uniref:Septin-type G domain-containing protein n=1 Tax=Dendrothele bispora (strain CBS 962.96) TaxID=1314807 RepID=A0A4S8MEG4_DENBC|nr:hypothetical protein K435DRAFT_793786 [Dendrothele bispora CBS 962.96]